MATHPAPALPPTLAAIVLLAMVESAHAVDEARFYPPEGWTVSRQPNGSAALQPPGAGATKTCTVLVMPDAEGEVNAVFALGWKTLTAEVKVASGGTVRTGKSMAGFETRWTTGVVDTPDTGRAYMHFFTVQTGPRVRRALFVADDQAQFDKHLPAVRAMLDSVGVDPAVAKQRREAAAAKGPDTGFQGVFYRGGVALNAAGDPGQLAQRVDYLCLSSDGRAYNGHPTGGPAACFDAEADDPRSPSYGRYSLSGDDLVIQWNPERSQTQPQTQKLKRRADGKLQQDANTVFHKFEPCDDLKLDGAYSRIWADGSRTRIRFTKDGRFTEQGLRDCVNLDNLAHPDWPKLPQAGGAGAYSIGRNTLEVKYDNDGPSRRMFFSTPDDLANPRRIAIANNPLEREP